MLGKQLRAATQFFSISMEHVDHRGPLFEILLAWVSALRQLLVHPYVVRDRCLILLAFVQLALGSAYRKLPNNFELL
jgi:hypothetical protein